MTTTSHANCTHEKTKAARAACRAGKLPAGEGMSAVDRLAAKAAATSAKISKPKHEWGDAPENPEAGRGPYAKIYMSGHCASGNHDACRGQYTLTPCTCRCHDAV